jgi:hypothetical protein
MLAYFWRFTMAKVIAPVTLVTADDIDNLGVLLADISRLTKQADNIKTRIKESKLPYVDGTLFRATVVKQDRTSYDPRKVEVMLGDKISLVEKVSVVTSVKLVALPGF